MLLWFVHGCSGKRMLSNMGVIMVLGMDAQVNVYSPMLLWFGHGCSGQRMLWNMDVIMVWAWMLW